MKKKKKTVKKASKKASKKPARKSAKRAAPRKSKKAVRVVKTILKLASQPKVAAPTKVNPLTQNQIHQFQDILTQKRDDLLDIVERKKKEEENFESSIDVAGDEADVATQSVEKEMLYELTDTEKTTLDMIEDALVKIERGVYGKCESCQNLIPYLRLDVMPWARYCIQCQSKQELPSAE